MRVALATNFIAPYRIPLFKILSETLGWEFKFFCSCEKEFDRLWETKKLPFNSKTSYNVSLKYREKYLRPTKFYEYKQIHFPIGLLFDLIFFKPDIIISAEFGARSLISCVYSILSNKPLILWFEGTSYTEKQNNFIRRLLRRFFFHYVKTFFASGCEAQNYLEKAGVKRNKIIDIKLAIDINPFKLKIENHVRAEMRLKFGISGLCYLYVGQFVELKGLYLLVKAWEIFCKTDRPDATLLLIGDGELKESLKKLVIKRQIPNVRFIKFIQPDDLPKFYKLADIFIFPTLHDVWGVVINEALASGLPVICSKYAGCATDLIIEGANGWIVDPLNITDIINKLRIARSSYESLYNMGKKGQLLISNITIEKMARKIIEALKFELNK